MSNVIVVPAQSSHVEVCAGETRVLLAVIDFGARLAGFALREQKSLHLRLLKALRFLGLALVSIKKSKNSRLVHLLL